MNFLQKAQETVKNLQNKEESPLQTQNPFVKPTENKTVAQNKPAAPGGIPKPPTSGLPKPPGAKPPIPGSLPGKPGGIPKPPVNTSVKKEEILTPEVKEDKKADVNKVEEKIEIKVETKTEEVDIKTDSSEKTDPSEKADDIPKVEEKEKPKKRGGRKTSKKKEEQENVTSDQSKDEDDYSIPVTEISYADAIESIKSNFVDKEWEDFRELTVKRINEIIISQDTNHLTLRSLINNLTNLREDIWLKFNDTKTLYENLSYEKPEGLIERVKKINLKGSNDNERRLNSVKAVMEYIAPNGDAINLYELLDETRERYNFLKGIMDSIQYKTDILITMLGSLKLETRQGGMSNANQ